MPNAASVRERTKADGTKYWAVLYRLEGKQTSTFFGDFTEAKTFTDLPNKFGVENALTAVQAQQRTTKPDGFTVASWLTHHVDHLTGVDRTTTEKYRRYIRRDVNDLFGGLLLVAQDRCTRGGPYRKWVRGDQQRHPLRGWPRRAGDLRRRRGLHGVRSGRRAVTGPEVGRTDALASNSDSPL